MVRRVANPLALANTFCAERGINPSETFTFPLNPPLSKGDLVVGCPATNDSPRGERKGMDGRGKVLMVAAAQPQ